MSKKEETDLSKLEFKKSYVFNEKTQQYIILLKNIGKNLIVEKSLIDQIITCYTNFYGDASTINELSLKFSIPPKYIEGILKALEVTHDSLPIDPVSLQDKTEENIVEELLQTKRFNVYEKFQKKSWIETQSKASKYDAFKHNVYHPFEDFVKQFSPKPVKPLTKLKIDIPRKRDENHLLITVSDIHFGSHAKSREMFNEKDWNIENCIESVDDYAERIYKDCATRNWNLRGITCIVLGDLIHGINGETHKGTKIEAHPVRQEQFDLAFNSLIQFFSKISQITKDLTIYSVNGNHSELDSVLMKCIAAYFRNDNSIKFHILESRYGLVRVKDVLVGFEHGASLYYKSKSPKGVAREAYWQKIFSQAPLEMKKNTVQSIAIQGDLHANEWVEYADFDFFQVGTIVGSDFYANNNNWRSRAKQNAFLIDYKGVKEILNYYF